MEAVKCSKLSSEIEILSDNVLSKFYAGILSDAEEIDLIVLINEYKQLCPAINRAIDKANAILTIISN